ncbi:MAG: SAM-dependent chlorinase/fluorinase [Deltaproteobacteria bacterium]|nr:SAM-dependent chlorinase/fluorinase [Deltaproteobacteria bacterium]
MRNNNDLPAAAPAPCGIITLTADFGTGDWYAGALKGVLMSINPQCRPVDLTHGIAPQDIQAGSFCLAQACPLFPAGTVHIAVVDPGVGSDRKPLLVVTEQHYFVGPDNGLFTGVMQAAASYACIELTNAAYFRSAVSSTFHGRDIFAPAAAHITRGIAPLAMGRLIDDPVMLAISVPETGADGCLTGAIVHMDHFGNLITNIAAESVARMAQQGEIAITCGGTILQRICSCYEQAPAGEPFGIIGSSRTLEISLRNASAREALNARRGQSVTVRPQTAASETVSQQPNMSFRTNVRNLK